MGSENINKDLIAYVKIVRPQMIFNLQKQARKYLESILYYSK